MPFHSSYEERRVSDIYSFPNSHIFQWNQDLKNHLFG